MAHIGKPSIARKFYNFVNGYNYSNNNNDPEFEWLDGGGCRAVALHKPTGVVYKNDSGDGPGWDNASEVRHARALARKPLRHVAIPRVSGFKVNGTVVVAMEYIPGENGHAANIPAEARQELYDVGQFEDMHAQNFRYYKGKVWPIDMASPRGRLVDADRRVLS